MGARKTLNKYKELGTKDFIKKWLEGIEGITPLQQTRTSLMGTWIIVTGIIWGIVVVWFTGMYWLFIILIGSLIVTLTQLLSMWQKFKTLKRIDKMQKEMVNNV